ncbi:uncharacterized protein LOC121873411 [Homarus americanus]|uniref:uncharacterized protein LOC121873411 n=1 Tax=Homarus americanus TaxID=6706 RepID=UPI001C492CB8|nr:uncharacterized protein LOC121873411 [Homarus americanus]
MDDGGAAVVNELQLGPLTRGDLGRRLSCLASNTNQTQPATTTVTLAMTLSIVGVRVEEVTSVWAEEQAEVKCRVWGSRPPPTVVWWLGSVMLPPTHTKVVEDGNLTISILHFTPKPQDDGAMLICQATNEKLPDQAVQDSRLLSVSYAPQVRVLLGKSLDPLRIKEGDDVYFECQVDAKPPIFKVAWRHNGVELLAGAGVFVSNMSLVVQRVTRGHGGDYTCEASNIKDTSSSPPLHLDVKYAPVCARQERVQHSVAKLENAEISCRVHANPANVTFRWTFNNTAEAIDVPDGRFVVAGTESRVNYTPMNELDYGTLLCWANNTIGLQQHPCVFHIVAAGTVKPLHPHLQVLLKPLHPLLQVLLNLHPLLQVLLNPSSTPSGTVKPLHPHLQVLLNPLHPPSGTVKPLHPHLQVIVKPSSTPSGTVKLFIHTFSTVKPLIQFLLNLSSTSGTVKPLHPHLQVLLNLFIHTFSVLNSSSTPSGTVKPHHPLFQVLLNLFIQFFRTVKLIIHSFRCGRNNVSASGGESWALLLQCPQPPDPPLTRSSSLPSTTRAPPGSPSQAYTVRIPETQEETSADLAAEGGGRLLTHSKDGASTGLPSEASPPDDRNPDLISHTPDPTECQEEHCAEIATISASSSFFLHNGGPTYPASSCAAPAATSATVGGAEYTQLVCSEALHGPQAAAVSHVPYFHDSQQPQVREVTLPQEYPGGSSGQSYSTLERKRRQGGGCHSTYDHQEHHHPEAYVDTAHHNPFPHLYQAPTGSFCHTPHGSQYNLSQYQASLAHLPHPVGSPTQSLQGTLRRGSKKVHKSSSSGAPPTHPHHHHCEVHEPKSPLPSESGQVDSTLKRERRREARVGEGVDRGGDESEMPTPNTERKSKRESAV